MANHRPLTELTLNRRSTEELLAHLLSNDPNDSAKAGLKLCNEAKQFGLTMRDYLRLAIDPQKGDNAARFEGLNGYEASLAHLQLPVQNDFDAGIVLQAASNTFQTFPGTRMLFPEVVDDMLRWRYRQDNFESTAPFLANSRTITQTELISTWVEDEHNGTSGNEQYYSAAIPEMGRIPVRTIRTSETAVKIWKHGSGYRTSYEFERRATLDMLTPFAARTARELELSKVHHATNVLINGDGVNGAATVKDQDSFAGYDGDKAGELQYRPLLRWLVARAKAGTPVDTVIGNWDAYVDWLLLFAPTTLSRAEAEALAAQGAPNLSGRLPILNFDVAFALSSAVPDDQLIGITRGETLEELIEANSSIQESERAIQNQAITYVRTENAGYKLVWGDTREIYDYSE